MVAFGLVPILYKYCSLYLEISLSIVLNQFFDEFFFTLRGYLFLKLCLFYTKILQDIYCILNFVLITTLLSLFVLFYPDCSLFKLFSILCGGKSAHYGEVVKFWRDKFSVPNPTDHLTTNTYIPTSMNAKPVVS